MFEKLRQQRDYWWFVWKYHVEWFKYLHSEWQSFQTRVSDMPLEVKQLEFRGHLRWILDNYEGLERWLAQKTADHLNQEIRRA